MGGGKYGVGAERDARVVILMLIRAKTGREEI